MEKIQILNKDGREIVSVPSWHDLAPPQSPDGHWEKWKSAFEFANAWFRTEVAEAPQPLREFFKHNKLTRDISLKEIIAEKPIWIDDVRRGNTRNNDMLLDGYASNSPIVVGIEAKAKEEYGPIIGKYYDKHIQNTASNIPQRIRRLSQAIFGRDLDNQVRALRYQLLHAIAGTLIEAKSREAKYAIFLIYQFITPIVTPSDRRRNSRDLNKFIQLLSQDESIEINPGKLYGPFKIPGGEYVPSSDQLYIGKVMENIETDAIKIRLTK